MLERRGGFKPEGHVDVPHGQNRIVMFDSKVTLCCCKRVLAFGIVILL